MDIQVYTVKVYIYGDIIVFRYAIYIISLIVMEYQSMDMNIRDTSTICIAPFLTYASRLHLEHLMALLVMIVIYMYKLGHDMGNLSGRLFWYSIIYSFC